jgi:hypothetical protein
MNDAAKVRKRAGGAGSGAEAVRAVEFRAEVRQVKTMADHTVNVTLNLPEDCREQAKKVIDWLGLEVHGVLAVYSESKT